MFIKKIIGWLLLAFGLIIIALGLYQSFAIFSGRTEPPKVFQLENPKPVEPIQDNAKPASVEELQQQMQKMIGEQIQGIFPVGFISRLLNLITWSIFVWILILGGSKISGIGMGLIREN